MNPQFEKEKPNSPESRLVSNQEKEQKDASDALLTSEEAEQLKKFVQSVIQENLLKISPKERKGLVVQNLFRIFEGVQGAKKQAVDEFLQKLSTQEYWEKDQELAESLAADLARFSQEHFSRKEIEDIRAKMRMRSIDWVNYTPLGNEGVFAYKKVGNSIEIHLFEPRGNLGILLALQLRRKFRIALEDLARIVQQDRDIEFVSATSWIVAEHQSAFEKFGFTFVGTEKNRDDPEEIVGIARMSREELLERYGKA